MTLGLDVPHNKYSNSKTEIEDDKSDEKGTFAYIIEAKSNKKLEISH